MEGPQYTSYDELLNLYNSVSIHHTVYHLQITTSKISKNSLWLMGTVDYG